jgi:hypothetical protein
MVTPAGHSEECTIPLRLASKAPHSPPETSDFGSRDPVSAHGLGRGSVLMSVFTAWSAAR